MNGDTLRIGIIIIGVVLVFISFWKHSVKKLAVNYAVIWALLGALMVLLGAVPVLSAWTKLLSKELGLVVFCGGVLLLFTEVQSSLTISQLTFKNRELAMHVALLNQESERVMDEVKELLNIQDDGTVRDVLQSGAGMSGETVGGDANEKDSVRG